MSTLKNCSDHASQSCIFPLSATVLSLSSFLVLLPDSHKNAQSTSLPLSTLLFEKPSDINDVAIVWFVLALGDSLFS
jgi:hypothetical protein